MELSKELSRIDRQRLVFVGKRQQTLFMQAAGKPSPNCLTQSQLAGLAGLSEDYISAMERGIQGDSITALLYIGSVLRIEGHELLRHIEIAMRNNPKPPARKVGKPQKWKSGTPSG